MVCKKPTRAFTLVELLVVIGVIGILVAVLLPALNAARTGAKEAATNAQFVSISAGLETYRNDTGEQYPPSSGDNPNARWQVASPFAGDGRTIYVTGANLMVWALAGADLLGTATFKDLGNARGWHDDTFGGEVDADDVDDAGLYTLLSSTLDPAQRRYNAYINVSDGDLISISEFAEDTLEPKAAAWQDKIPTAGDDPDKYQNQLVMLDGFGYPILYYRATPGARQMIATNLGGNPNAGIFTQEDNALYTGGNNLPFSGSVGLDFGAGSDHDLDDWPDDEFLPGTGEYPWTNPDPANQYYRTFARFIRDQKVTRRNEPVNKDSYILVSPGPDALWGTEDDLANFDR